MIAPRKNFSLLIIPLALLAVVSGAFVQEIRAESQSILLFGKEDATVLYSTESSASVRSVTSLNFGFFTTSKLLQEDKDVKNQKVFISPNGKYLAVTTLQKSDGAAYTYIADLDGNIIVRPHIGYFISWSPDSEKTLLYLSDLRNPDGTGMRIYYLHLSGAYEDSGLPQGVASADISADGNIVYVLTDQKTDRSSLYIRDPYGNDRLLLKGDDNIFAWVRWSPTGDKIAFLKSDLYLNGDKNEIWSINSDGSNAQMISKVSWSYPPVWSPDGSTLAFAHNGVIWEYDTSSKVVSQAAHIPGKSFKHPAYSEDGQTLVFSDGEQIWVVRDGVIEQVTTGEGKRDYPITP